MRPIVFLSLLLFVFSIFAEEIDKKFPLDPQLKVLSEDVKNERYREMVTKKMLSTDLAAEWQRGFTADNPDSFLEKNGGREKVLANPDLKAAYDRRLSIQNDFLDLMREGYKRHKAVPPFDKGAKAEIAGTTIKSSAIKKGATLSTSLVAKGAEKHWPRFRGPSGQGLTGLNSLPTKWNDKSENILWKITTPDLGNSSPIVWEDKIFITSATSKGASRTVHCFSSKDGAKIWSTPIPESIPETSVLGKNGYASSPPVTDGERVIVFLGSSGLVCLDFAGKIQWQYNNLNIKTTHGTGSSPVIHGDLVLFFHDQNQSDSICIALDKKTGKEVWKQKRDKGMTWCTPVVIKVGDHDEVIFAGSGTVRGYDPATGNELWKLQGPTSEVVPTIVVGTELAYSASGRNGPTIAFRLGEKGDITASSTVWKSVRNGPHVPSPILVKDKLFTFNDMGISTCLDATTGKLLWTERLPDQFTASPIEAGGFIYVSGESGKTYVLKVSDKFELVATNDLGSPILASPAIVNGNLLLRTRDALYCIGTK